MSANKDIYIYIQDTKWQLYSFYRINNSEVIVSDHAFVSCSFNCGKLKVITFICFVVKNMFH